MDIVDICKREFEAAFCKIKRYRDASVKEDYEKQFRSYTQTAFLILAEMNTQNIVF